MTEFDYEANGFFKDYVYFCNIGEDNDRLIEAYLRIAEDENYADIIYNGNWYVGEWLEDEEKYIVFL